MFGIIRKHLSGITTANFQVTHCCNYIFDLPIQHLSEFSNLVLNCVRTCNGPLDYYHSCFIPGRYNALQSLKKQPLIKECSTVAMNLPGLEVTYFIPSHGFANQMSRNSSIEEAVFAHSLKILRQEKFIGNGYKKKLECITGNNQTCIKVMNYNVLSQTLLEEHSFLYANINPSVLRWDFRYPKLLGQIRSEDPDILCLQEVQESHLANFSCKLEELGYKGLFKKKTGNKSDGCAIFYKSKTFNVVDFSNVEFFRPKVALLNRHNVGLILRLNLNGSPGNDLVIGTTHLLFNPKRLDVRLAQIQLFLAEIHRISNLGGKKCAVIMTGDLNSLPESSVVKLITTGSVQHSYTPIPPDVGVLPTCEFADPDSVRLFYNEKFGYETAQKNTTNMTSPGNSPFKKYHASSNNSFNLSHDLNFRSVYSFKENNTTVATTFQNEWVTVDYMFYSCCEKIELLSRLRLPTSYECYEHIRYLPNYASPSDHLPLVATFAFNLK